MKSIMVKTLLFLALILGFSGCRGSNIVDSKETVSFVSQLCNYLAKLSSDSILLDSSTKMFGTYKSEKVDYHTIDGDYNGNLTIQFHEDATVSVSGYNKITGRSFSNKSRYEKSGSIVSLLDAGIFDLHYLITDDGFVGPFVNVFTTEGRYLNESDELVVKAFGQTETIKCNKVMYGKNAIYSYDLLHSKHYFIVGKNKEILEAVLLGKSLNEQIFTFKLVRNSA